MLRYLQSWIDQLRWQRLVPFQNLAHLLLDHLDGILNYCRTKVRFGVVEAINGNIKTLLRRGRGYKNLGYLLLKAQRMAVTNGRSGGFSEHTGGVFHTIWNSVEGKHGPPPPKDIPIGSVPQKSQ